jgi:hypothetical protein
MPSAVSLPHAWPIRELDPERELLTLSEQTFRVVAVAQAMVASNRRVDLDGLQHQVGLLCAKALDLPPARTGLARMELRRLATGLDALHTAMRGDPA